MVRYNDATVKDKILNDMRSNVDLYRFFYDHILAYVCGKTHWKDLCTTTLGSNIVNVGDEAFALLVVENSWDCWAERYMQRYKKEEFEEKERQERASKGLSPLDTGDESLEGADSDKSDERCKTYRKRKITAPLYTVQDGGGRDEEGWCPAAIQRYNALRAKVRENRAEHTTFDVGYLAWKKELAEGRKRNRRVNPDDTRIVVAENDLSEDERG